LERPGDQGEAVGTHEIQANVGEKQRNVFMKALLNDVRALQHMLSTGLVESRSPRIGAEQELVLIDRDWQPAPVAMEVLDEIDDPRVTTEIARFNLECNLDPIPFTGRCLAELEAELQQVIELLRTACRKHGADVLLTGILPTISKSHLGKENISDRPRYFALDDALRSLRGGAYELNIRGIDEVSIEHESVLLEGLNTSFQIHYQVCADDFARQYNVAQAVAGPLLACAVNSPVLFGKRLWRETRIAIFQDAVDTRHDAPLERELLARVRFGEGWIEDSALEIFKNDIARFRAILCRDIDEEPFEAIEAGRAPLLQALQLFNSTVYRWNRACYGISDGKPHLRIENRVLPAGPTVVDEVANAAFWFGLMRGGPEALGDIRTRLDFDEARANFVAAAHQGMHAQFTWTGGRYLSARTLILDELMPIARVGLQAAQIDSGDVDTYLGIIHDRVDSCRTGAQWLLDSVAAMRGRGTRAERQAALTAAIFNRQTPSPMTTVRPVHQWTKARLEEAGGWTRNFQRVEQYMATDIFSVHENDTIDLVVTLMDWRHIRHVPVEDEQHRLIGLVSYRPLLHHLAKCLASADTVDAYSIPVRMIMARDPITVSPETTTLDAIALMREKRVSCLPVTKDGKLVGLVTEHDFMSIAGQLLEDHLRNHDAAGQR
jgi:CBS domain-containing protein